MRSPGEKREGREEREEWVKGNTVKRGRKLGVKSGRGGQMNKDQDISV